MAERNVEELNRSSENKSESIEILQNDLNKDKEKIRIEINNSEDQIRTTDVVEKLQEQCVAGKLSSHAEKRKITPEKEPGTFCIIVSKHFITVNTELNFCMKSFDIKTFALYFSFYVRFHQEKARK